MWASTELWAKNFPYVFFEVRTFIRTENAKRIKPHAELTVMHTTLANADLCIGCQQQVLDVPFFEDGNKSHVLLETLHFLSSMPDMTQ